MAKNLSGILLKKLESCLALNLIEVGLRAERPEGSARGSRLPPTAANVASSCLIQELPLQDQNQLATSNTPTG